MNITFKIQEDATFKVYNNDKHIGNITTSDGYWRFKPEEKWHSPVYTDVFYLILDKDATNAKSELIRKFNQIEKFYLNLLK